MPHLKVFCMELFLDLSKLYTPWETGLGDWLGLWDPLLFINVSQSKSLRAR